MARHKQVLLAVLCRLSAVFAIRIGEIGIRYAFNLVLAVELSVQGAGQFYLGFSIVTLAASLSRFGMDSIAMRHLAVARAEGDAELARGIAASALGSTAMVGIVISTILFLSAPFMVTRVFGVPDFLPDLRLFALGTVVLAVLTTAASLLNALDRPIMGQVVLALAWPLLTTAWILLGGRDHAVAGAVLAMAAAALAGVALVGQSLGTGRLRPASARGLLGGAAPLFGVEITYLLLTNLPILALGYWATEAEVGLLGLASRISALLTVFTVAMYAVAAPRLARLHAAGDAEQLERAAHGAARSVMALALPSAAAMLLFPSTLLALFGEDFRAGAPLLIVLTLGQLVNVLFCQCHTLLAMSGNERWLLRCAVATLGVMGLTLALLVPMLGALGASLSAAAATVTMSLGSYIGVRRKLGLNILGAYSIAKLTVRMGFGPGRRVELPE